MKKIHVLIVAALLGLSAAVGLVAATKTARLGPAASTRASSAAITARSRRLDRVQLQLRRALRDRPPALPAVPTANRGSAASPPRIVYQRPAPLVVINHAARHADDGAEPESHDD
jgi:hypothetical protein